MVRVLSIIFLVFIFGMLIFTNRKEIERGEVTETGFKPPHYERVKDTVVGGNTSFVWTDKWIPDTTWYIKFKDGYNKREIIVSESEANSYQIGDSININ